MGSVVALVLGVLAGALVLGWGPGNHLGFAGRVLRRRRSLPGDVGRLLAAEGAAFLYGNVAADIIHVKSWGGHANHCHRWTIVDEMRERAGTPAQEAFVLGYLAHLAADTIAHNHFVPYHLARHERSRGLGHLFWEINADRLVPESTWELLGELRSADQVEDLDELVDLAVPRKALPMSTNRWLFRTTLEVVRKRSWREGLGRLHPAARRRLARTFLRRFQRAALERIELALEPGGVARLEHIDTAGKEAQRNAMRLRRERGPEALDEDAARELAAPFLLGMEPPRRPVGAPHWERREDA